MNANLRLVLAALLVVVLAAACQPAARPSTAVQLQTLNASGVTGTVMLVDLGDGRTQVDIRVQPGDNPDMPAHIHPGSCTTLIPQPQHPLENVVNGASTTIVRASVAELTAGGLAVNLHKSNEDLRTYTACADL
jgi:hypothetical protein